MRNIIIALVCFVISNANALDFHFGNRTVPLTTVKHTIPSLNVRDAGGTVHYGALFNINDYNVPANVVHVRDYDGVEYFLSPWCDAGYYPSSDTNECVPCGYGHYCTGGNHRESCTYGIIACNTTTASFDPPMPAGTDGMYNRALTMDEINQYVPVTDISMYDTIYKNNPVYKIYFNCEAVDNGADPNDTRLSVLDHEIEKGTYIAVHKISSTGKTCALDGEYGFSCSAYFVVFDHDVSYRPVHICHYFHNFFDTLNIPFSEWNLRIPFSYDKNNENITNVSNLENTVSFPSSIGSSGLALFKLK